MGIVEFTKPEPKKSGFYENGLYLEYKLQWRVVDYDKIREGHGVLKLKVEDGKINLNVTIPGYYPDGDTLYREVYFNLSGDNVTYMGKKIVLPFFYSGGKIVSYYKGCSVNVTDRKDILATLQGGTIQYQPVYYLYTEDYMVYPNGSLWEKGNPATYEYGKNTNLLFFYYTGEAYDPIMHVLLNLTYPMSIPNGTVFYEPIELGLSLHSTNLDLGPVNYFAVILTYIVIALPVILLVCIPLLIIGIYRVVKERRSKSEW